MGDYAGWIRSESMLDAGLTYLWKLKDKAHTTMMAENQHELVHCLEVLNFLDVGELVFLAVNERKETRGQHIRSDYRLINPMMQKLLIITKVDEKVTTEWRQVQT